MLFRKLFFDILEYSRIFTCFSGLKNPSFSHHSYQPGSTYSGLYIDGNSTLVSAKKKHFVSLQMRQMMTGTQAGTRNVQSQWQENNHLSLSQELFELRTQYSACHSILLLYLRMPENIKTHIQIQLVNILTCISEVVSLRAMLLLLH